MFILESSGIANKIIDDIELSKVFSIIGFSVFEMLTNIGLLKAKLETVKSSGDKKFRLDKIIIIRFLHSKLTISLKLFVILLQVLWRQHWKYYPTEKIHQEYQTQSID